MEYSVFYSHALEISV